MTEYFAFCYCPIQWKPRVVYIPINIDDSEVKNNMQKIITLGPKIRIDFEDFYCKSDKISNYEIIRYWMKLIFEVEWDAFGTDEYMYDVPEQCKTRDELYNKIIKTDYAGGIDIKVTNCVMISEYFSNGRSIMDL